MTNTKPKRLEIDIVKLGKNFVSMCLLKIIKKTSYKFWNNTRHSLEWDYLKSELKFCSIENCEEQQLWSSKI